MSMESMPNLDSYAMRLRALQRSSTQIGARYTLRKPQYYDQAVANFEADYAAYQAEHPGFSYSEEQKRAEIERMRLALVEMNALKANERSRESRAAKARDTQAQQAKKSRARHGKTNADLTGSQLNHPTTRLDRTRQ